MDPAACAKDEVNQSAPSPKEELTMSRQNRTRTMLLTLGTLAIAVGACWLHAANLDDHAESAMMQTVAAPDDKSLADAYVYLLGRALVIRQEQIDKNGEGFSYNAIKYNPLGSADFVNPNFDVAYLEAWIAADDTNGVILEVPKVEGRYYTAQILDEWGEVIANINERTFPSKPYGKFALVKPGSKVKVPTDTGRIELHSSKAKMLARVELKGDKEGAVKLQREFKLTPMGDVKVAPVSPMPMFNNKDLIGVEIFDNLDATLASALDVAPNAAEMQQKARAIAAYVASSPEARKSIDQQIHARVVPEIEDYTFTKSAPYRNHWVGGASAGNYGKNYWLRTSVNYAGIWANDADEVLYFVATKDADEKPLNGSNSYIIHFPADKLPDSVVSAYWSVILVGVPDYRVVPNPLNRYNLNNHSPLQKESDGSLKIAIGPKPVAGVSESNWLPSAEGKPFSLTFRTYVPKGEVKNGQWTPPPADKVQ
jgi:hypothetical protein